MQMTPSKDKIIKARKGRIGSWRSGSCRQKWQWVCYAIGGQVDPSALLLLPGQVALITRTMQCLIDIVRDSITVAVGSTRQYICITRYSNDCIYVATILSSHKYTLSWKSLLDRQNLFPLPPCRYFAMLARSCCYSRTKSAGGELSLPKRINMGNDKVINIFWMSTKYLGIENWLTIRHPLLLLRAFVCVEISFRQNWLMRAHHS